MKIKAYAKINLTLDIKGVRDDGFHELESVMVPVSLCDELIIEKSDRLSFKCNIPSLETDDNLCVRAANRFFEKSGIKSSAEISLTKNIPFPAGLGGGSADAAAVLRGLNKLYSNPLDDDALFEIAASLGSDISVCLLGKAALCQGRGEVLTPLENVPNFNILIAIGKSRLSTPAVYREYDALNLPPRNDSESFLECLPKGDSMSLISSFGNAFEPVADVLAPETKEIRELMLSNRALSAHLSGSGPSVFGVFESEADVERASNALSKLGYNVYPCKTI